MQIVSLETCNPAQLDQAARVLWLAFKEFWPEAWPTLERAAAEVQSALEGEKIRLAAIRPDGDLVGWIGAIPAYGGHAWELHPLAVHPDHQRQGIGSALVVALEGEVRRSGAVCLFLGSDDESGMTSVGGIDLYPDPLAHLAGIKDFKGHPFTFYQKAGYAIAGIIPDANGYGKPDIIMAKRLTAPD